MKILYFSPHPKLGLYDKAGYSTHMLKVIQALRDNDVIVETFIAGGEIQDSNVKIQLDKPRKSFFKRVIPKIIWETLKDVKLLLDDRKIGKQLQKKIKEFNPDAIYERTNYMQLSGIKICRKEKITHIAEINSPYIEERMVLQGKSWLEFIARSREKKLLEKSDNVIVVSSALKDYFISKYKLSSHKLVVIPNAVDGLLKSKKIDSQQKNGLDKVIIGFVGSIAPWHGIDRLLKAAIQMTETRRDFEFLIVGGGSDLENYKSIANGLKISEYFNWVGSIDHEKVTEYLNEMDITVMPDSNWYGSPIKIFEYGIHCKPIVAPNYAPLRDVMENGIDGILIDQGEKALSEAILRLMADRELRINLSENFYRKIISNFTWNHVALRIILIVNSVNKHE